MLHVPFETKTRRQDKEQDHRAAARREEGEGGGKKSINRAEKRIHRRRHPPHKTKTIWEQPERARAPILELELELSDVGGEDGDVC